MVAKRLFSTLITALALICFKNRKFCFSHARLALVAQSCLVLPLSVVAKLLGSWPVTASPGLAALMARAELLHKTNQTPNHHQCCWFLEERLKAGGVFCASKHKVSFGLFSVDFGQALGAVCH